jgi:hypothetical protein
MEWCRDFTALVLLFARRLADIDVIPLDEALMIGTPLYPNFRLGTTFDPDQPLWQEFLAGYQATADPLEWTHAFYLSHARQYSPHPYGCFRYHYNPETRTAGLHFGNLDTSGHGALSRAQRPERIRELTAMFSDIRRVHPEAEAFAGSSWLYNLPGYQALFPPEYIATMIPTRPRFTYMDVWGQFLNGKWDARAAPSREFAANIDQSTNRADLEASFPFSPLLVQGPIRYFYAFYHIE